MAKKGIGRPTKFTPEVRGVIVQTIRAGAPYSAACKQAGIHPSTFYLWCQIGQAYRDGEDHPNMPHLIADREAYSEFLDEVEKAVAGQQIRAVANIIRQGTEHWVHRKTGQISITRPRPVTYLNTTTGMITFDDPRDGLGAAEAAEWEREWSGHAWDYHAGQWTALAWFLERTDPESYAKTTKTQVGNMPDEKFQVELTDLTDEQLIELLNRYT